MKIANTPTFIQRSNNSSIIDKTSNSKLNMPNNIELTLKDNINIVKHDVSNISRINSLQKDLTQSQRMFGALTLLNEAIKSFQEKPNIQKQTIQKILEDIKNESPTLSSALSKNMNDLSTMTTDISQKSKEIYQRINTQKKEISQYLITEQNKDALNNRSISTSDIPNKLDKNLHISPSSKLLS